jgi:ribosomal protein L4
MVRCRRDHRRRRQLRPGKRVKQAAVKENAWGVVRVDGARGAVMNDPLTPVMRHGGVVFARAAWYDRHVALGGKLSAVAELTALADSVAGGCDGNAISGLLALVRQQYSEVFRDAPPMYPRTKE